MPSKLTFTTVYCFAALRMSAALFASPGLGLIDLTSTSFPKLNFPLFLKAYFVWLKNERFRPSDVYPQPRCVSQDRSVLLSFNLVYERGVYERFQTALNIFYQK
ncbi:hypothetical protein BH11BAC5_BH11BAC5_15230 [soil metagenome]